MIYLLRRFSAFLLSFFFCLTLLVPSALADDGFTSSGGSDFDNDYGVRWSGFVDDGSKTGVFVKAPDMWSAAVYACGGNPGLLSAEVRSKLSDPNYGGRFYAYAQSFGHIMSVSEIPGWVPLYILAAEGIANVWHGDFGDMLLWSSKVPNSLISGAMVDFRRVLSGDDLGGSVVPLGGYLAIPVRSFESSRSSSSLDSGTYFSAQNATYVDGTLVIGSGTTRYSPYIHSSYWVSSGYVYANDDLISLADSYINQGYQVFFAKGLRSNCNLVVGHDLSFSYDRLSNGVYVYRLHGSDVSACEFTCTPYYNASDGVFCFVPDFSSPSFDSVSMPNSFSYFSEIFTVPFNGPPSGTWPEPSHTPSPTAPDLPDPAQPTVTPEPTVTTPTPTWPDVDITVNPPAVVAPVTPDGLDYTELLERINDNLNSINAYVVAVNSSLNSLRSDLVTEFDSVVQSLRNIYGYLQHMDSVLEVHCVHIRNKIEESAVFIANYMRSLVHWLAEQLDYDDTYGTDSYDDSLLTTINEKLGGGTYEPNPIKDELGYYEWLDDLWERFLLGDDWESSASSISASFGQLRTRFPFSIPWDIVALFRLFVHEPVTPVFDLPLYFSGSSSTPVRVDLTPWDGVASVVRPLIYVIFALKLALLSRDLLAGLGADKGGLS